MIVARRSHATIIVCTCDNGFTVTGDSETAGELVNK